MDTWEEKVKGSVDNMRYGASFLSLTSSQSTQSTAVRATAYYGRLSSIHVAIQELKRRLTETDDKIDGIQKDIDSAKQHHVGVSEETTNTHQQIKDSFTAKESVTNWLNIFLALQIVVTIVVMAVKLKNEKTRDFNLGI